MDKKEFCVVIKKNFLKGKTPQEIKNKLEKYYDDSAPSIRTVYKWFSNFQTVPMNMDGAEHVRHNLN